MNRRPNDRRIFMYAFLLIIIFLTSEFPSISHGSTGEKEGQRKNQDKWWSEDRIVKEVLVSYLEMRERIPDLKKESGFYSDLIQLLLLFDSMYSEASMKTLASLSSYYLGSAGGEIYSCILIRKGPLVEEVLSHLLTENSNECNSRFGSNSENCYDNINWKRRVKLILKRIRQNETCAIQK